MVKCRWIYLASIDPMVKYTMSLQQNCAAHPPMKNHIQPRHHFGGLSSWSTLLLNVCDLSRFSPTQKDQAKERGELGSTGQWMICFSSEKIQMYSNTCNNDRWGVVSYPILTSPRWVKLSIYGWTNDLNNDVVFRSCMEDRKTCLLVFMQACN